jgi:hypothetical protein
MSNAMLSPAEVDMLVSTSVTWCHAVLRRGHDDLARELRDDFLREWDVPDALWNDHVDSLIDYAERKGETPGVTVDQLQQIRC